MIGLTTFRRSERWAWFAIAVFVAAAVLTELRDGLAWGGWFTFLFLGLAPLLGLLLCEELLWEAIQLDGPGPRERVVRSLPGWPAWPAIRATSG